MSAFVVSQPCMDRCVLGISLIVPSFGGLALYDASQLNELGRLLYRMNSDAVRGRYPDDPAMVVEGDRLVGKYLFAPPSDRRPVALFKAMVCVCYQCAEDATFGSPSYVSLEHAIGRSAHRIVTSSPEYELAAWDE